MNEVRGKTSIMIEAPVTAVYDYLADFTRHPEWVKNVQKVTPMNGSRARVGARFKTQEGPPPVAIQKRLRMMVHFMRGLFSGAKSYSIAEMTGLEPNKRIAWRGGIPKGGGYFNVSEWEIILQAQGEATLVTQHFCYQPQTAIAHQMIAAAGNKGIEQACAVNLAQLKQRLEQPKVHREAPA